MTSRSPVLPLAGGQAASNGGHTVSGGRPYLPREDFRRDWGLPSTLFPITDVS